ncbi:MAG: hypothetical protein HQ594_03600 [Candidatus Omnitrophica bacterium]|nr:hypothetical protein [Candidatus Omnitrophota bacterium]
MSISTNNFKTCLKKATAITVAAVFLFNIIFTEVAAGLQVQTPCAPIANPEIRIPTQIEATLFGILTQINGKMINDDLMKGCNLNLAPKKGDGIVDEYDLNFRDNKTGMRKEGDSWIIPFSFVDKGTHRECEAVVAPNKRIIAMREVGSAGNNAVELSPLGTDPQEETGKFYAKKNILTVPSEGKAAADETSPDTGPVTNSGGISNGAGTAMKQGTGEVDPGAAVTMNTRRESNTSGIDPSEVKSVLILDDRPEHIEQTCESIRDLYPHISRDSIKKATSLYEAAGIIKRNPPFDLVISDVDLSHTIWTKLSQVEFNHGLIRLTSAGKEFVMCLAHHRKKRPRHIILQSTMFEERITDRIMAFFVFGSEFANVKKKLRKAGIIIQPKSKLIKNRDLTLKTLLTWIMLLSALYGVGLTVIPLYFGSFTLGAFVAFSGTTIGLFCARIPRALKINRDSAFTLGAEDSPSPDTGTAMKQGTGESKRSLVTIATKKPKAVEHFTKEQIEYLKKHLGKKELIDLVNKLLKMALHKKDNVEAVLLYVKASRLMTDINPAVARELKKVSRAAVLQDERWEIVINEDGYIHTERNIAETKMAAEPEEKDKLDESDLEDAVDGFEERLRAFANGDDVAEEEREASLIFDAATEEGADPEKNGAEDRKADLTLDEVTKERMIQKKNRVMEEKKTGLQVEWQTLRGAASNSPEECGRMDALFEEFRDILERSPDEGGVFYEDGIIYDSDPSDGAEDSPSPDTGPVTNSGGISNGAGTAMKQGTGEGRSKSSKAGLKNILHVEHHKKFGKHARRAIERRFPDVAVLTASNLHEAADILREKGSSIDAIVSNYHFGIPLYSRGMSDEEKDEYNAVELLCQVTKLRLKMPVIIHSGVGWWRTIKYRLRIKKFFGKSVNVIFINSVRAGRILDELEHIDEWLASDETVPAMKQGTGESDPTTPPAAQTVQTYSTLPKTEFFELVGKLRKSIDENTEMPTLLKYFNENDDKKTDAAVALLDALTYIYPGEGRKTTVNMLNAYLEKYNDTEPEERVFFLRSFISKLKRDIARTNRSGRTLVTSRTAFLTTLILVTGAFIATGLSGMVPRYIILTAGLAYAVLGLVFKWVSVLRLNNFLRNMTDIRLSVNDWDPYQETRVYGMYARGIAIYRQFLIRDKDLDPKRKELLINFNLAEIQPDETELQQNRLRSIVNEDLLVRRIAISNDPTVFRPALEAIVELMARYPKIKVIVNKCTPILHASEKLPNFARALVDMLYRAHRGKIMFTKINGHERLNRETFLRAAKEIITLIATGEDAERLKTLDIDLRQEFIDNFLKIHKRFEEEIELAEEMLKTIGADEGTISKLRAKRTVHLFMLTGIALRRLPLIGHLWRLWHLFLDRIHFNKLLENASGDFDLRAFLGSIEEIDEEKEQEKIYIEAVKHLLYIREVRGEEDLLKELRIFQAKDEHADEKLLGLGNAAFGVIFWFTTRSYEDKVADLYNAIEKVRHEKPDKKKEEGPSFPFGLWIRERLRGLRQAFSQIRRNKPQHPQGTSEEDEDAMIRDLFGDDIEPDEPTSTNNERRTTNDEDGPAMKQGTGESDPTERMIKTVEKMARASIDGEDVDVFRGSMLNDISETRTYRVKVSRLVLKLIAANNGAYLKNAFEKASGRIFNIKDLEAIYFDEFQRGRYEHVILVELILKGGGIVRFGIKAPLQEDKHISDDYANLRFLHNMNSEWAQEPYDLVPVPIYDDPEDGYAYLFTEQWLDGFWEINPSTLSEESPPLKANLYYKDVTSGNPAPRGHHLSDPISETISEKMIMLLADIYLTADYLIDRISPAAGDFVAKLNGDDVSVKLITARDIKRDVEPWEFVHSLMILRLRPLTVSDYAFSVNKVMRALRKIDNQRQFGLEAWRRDYKQAIEKGTAEFDDADRKNAVLTALSRSGAEDEFFPDTGLSIKQGTGESDPTPPLKLSSKSLTGQVTHEGSEPINSTQAWAKDELIPSSEMYQTEKAIWDLLERHAVNLVSEKANGGEISILEVGGTMIGAESILKYFRDDNKVSYTIVNPASMPRAPDWVEERVRYIKKDIMDVSPEELGDKPK